MTLSTEQISNFFFIDIETVPQFISFDHLPTHMQELWHIKASKIPTHQQNIEDLYFQKAGIYAEFGKIICISIGVFYGNKEHLKFKIKSISGDNEKALLEEFSLLLQHNKEKLLCAHNGKEFDYPYLCRRMLIQGVKLPNSLQLSGLKPWENKHLDTLEMWKFGDYKNYTSLQLLATVLNVPSPKDDITGNQVAQVYYYEKNLQRITEYCQKDVITTARIVQRFAQIPLLRDEDIDFA